MLLGRADEGLVALVERLLRPVQSDQFLASYGDKASSSLPPAYGSAS
jgi:hypothetical protein